MQELELIVLHSFGTMYAKTHITKESSIQNACFVHPRDSHVLYFFVPFHSTLVYNSFLLHKYAMPILHWISGHCHW